jgi:hypothetical protein
VPNPRKTPSKPGFRIIENQPAAIEQPQHKGDSHDRTVHRNLGLAPWYETSIHPRPDVPHGRQLLRNISPTTPQQQTRLATRHGRAPPWRRPDGMIGKTVGKKIAGCKAQPACDSHPENNSNKVNIMKGIESNSTSSSTPKRTPKDLRKGMSRRGFVKRTDGHFVSLRRAELIKPDYPVPGQAECIDQHGNLIARVFWPLRWEGA